jgi:hypothetical protein
MSKETKLTIIGCFIIISAFVILKFSVLELNEKLRIKELENDSITHVNKTLLDSITRMQNDSLYKLFKISQSCNIDFKKQTNKFKIAHLDSIQKYCKKYNVPEKIAFKIVEHESRFDSSALGTREDKSYFQVTPIFYIHFKTEAMSEDLYGLMEVAIKGLSDIYKEEKNWSSTLSIYATGQRNKANEFVNFVLK